MKGLYIRNILYPVDRLGSIKIIRYYNLTMPFLPDICILTIPKHSLAYEDYKTNKNRMIRAWFQELKAFYYIVMYLYNVRAYSSDISSYIRF